MEPFFRRTDETNLEIIIPNNKINYLYPNILDIIIVKFFLDELHCQVLNKRKSLPQKKRKTKKQKKVLNKIKEQRRSIWIPCGPY